jgi:ribosome-associated translation inhibitor RaiA
MSTPSNFFLYIGKAVKDDYGRQVGKVTSFAVSPNGRISSVFIEQGDGEFTHYPSEQFKIDGENIILTPSIKVRVKTLCDEIPLIWRKDQALSELVDKKKIPQEMFSELHKNFEGALNQLRSEAQANLDNIDKQVSKCNQQTRELNSALVHLEIEKEIGRLDENSYKTALEIILNGLRKTNSEKNDLESMRSQLSNLILGDVPTPTSGGESTPPANVPPPQELPEPPTEEPVIVQVKSAPKKDH